MNEHEVLELGSLHVHASKRLLKWKGGKVVPLSLKEFEVLTALTRQLGRMETCEALDCEVWPGELKGNSNTIDEHLSTPQLWLDNVQNGTSVVASL